MKLLLLLSIAYCSLEITSNASDVINVSENVNYEELKILISETEKYINKFKIAPVQVSLIKKVLEGDKEAPRLIADKFNTMGTYFYIDLIDGSQVRLETATGELRQVDTDDLLRLAARWYKIAAERGDGLAMRGMARLAEIYLGSPITYEEWMKRSFETLRNSAETSRELLFLTRCYGRGEGTSIDNSKAEKTYLRYIERCKFEKKTDYVPPSNCMTPVPEDLKQYSSGEFTQEHLKSRLFYNE